MRRIDWLMFVVVVGLFLAFGLAATAFSAPASTGWDGTAPVNVAVQAPSSGGGGVINVGQAFGFLQPYIDSGVNALLAGAMGWLFWIARTRFNLAIDAGHRAALTTFLQNMAASLIADGFVTMSGKTVMVSGGLNDAITYAKVAIPDALKYFGFDGPGGPDKLAAKIVDQIPQVPAGAAIIAAAHAAPTGGTK